MGEVIKSILINKILSGKDIIYYYYNNNVCVVTLALLYRMANGSNGLNRGSNTKVSQHIEHRKYC